MLNRIKKYLFLLSYDSKIFIFCLIFLSLILGILEVIGITIVIPLIGLILQQDIGTAKNIPFADKLSNFLQYSGVVNFIILVIFIFFFKSIYVVFFSYLKTKLQFNIQKNLSDFFFQKYVYSKWNYLLNHNSSKLTSYVLKEIEIFATLNSSIIQLIAESIILLSILLLLSFFNFTAVLVVLIYAIIFIFLYTISTKKLLFKFGKLRQETDIGRLNFVQEGLKGIKDIKVYSIEKYFINILKNLNKKYVKINIIEKTIASIPYSLIEFTSICLIMSFILIFISSGDNPADLISLLGVFVAAFIRILPSFNRLIAIRHTLQFNFYVVDSLFEQYNIIKNFNNQKNINFKKFDDDTTLIKIENLYFSYNVSNNKNVSILENINLNIKKNKLIGISGSSGVGKTTFLDLLLGLHEPSKGKIYFNLINKSKIKNKDIEIGYVSQNIYLLNDSFLNNIAFGINKNKVDFNRILEVAKLAEISEFIESTKYRYDTLLGENGSKLSGGQKQRIAIARALYHDPDLIIFDEATNALDSLTEAKIRNNIYQISKNKTVIIISHNLENIKYCDVLYKIDKKNIVQIR